PSNRYGNYDVFVMPVTGGPPRRLTFHTGNDEVVGWTRDSQHVIFRATRGDGAFPTVATLYEVALTGGREQALPVDWGYSASYAPDGKSFVFNRHPAVWSRQHYRGAASADLWLANLTDKNYTKLLPDERFGIWKLDVATSRTSEVKLDIATDEKDNEIDVETVSDHVDSFDISPSGRRAAISVRGQILTIATERGDITRVVPDRMASRNQFPKWSADGKYVAFVSDRSGRDEVWIVDPEGRSPKKITDLDTEKGTLVFSPDSKSLLYTSGDKRLYNYTIADGKTATVASSD